MNHADQQAIQDWVGEGGSDKKPFYGEGTRFDGRDAEDATRVLRDRAEQIINIKDQDTRTQKTVDLVVAMDTNAMISVLKEKGIDVDIDEVTQFLHDSANQAIGKFDKQDLGREKSIEARNLAQLGAVDVTEKYFPSPSFIRENFVQNLQTINSRSRELATAFVTGNWEGIDLDNESIKQFIFVTLGAHTRWAVGQIERQLREGGNPIGRPIFGDLRRVYSAVSEQDDQDYKQNGSVGKRSTPDQINEKVIDMVERDWKEFWEVASGQKRDTRD